jgi:hypothetical protein
MAKGGLYRAEQRTGGIAGALKPIFDYFAQKREEEKQKEYITSLLSAYGDAEKRISEVATGFPQERTMRSNPLTTAPQPPTPQTVTNDMAGQSINLSMNPLNRGNALDQTTNTGVNRMTPKEQQYQTQDVANRFTVDALTKGEQKYANPNLVNVLGNVLQNKAARFQPKPIQQYSPGSDYGYFDDENNFHLTKSGVSTSNKTLYESENGKPKVYTLENGQKAYKKITTDFRGNKVTEDYEPMQFTPKSVGGKSGSGNSDGDGENDDRKSYGKLLGVLNSGIKKIEGFKKKFTQNNGNYFPSPDLPYYKTRQDESGATQRIGYKNEEYRNFIESEKAEYLDEAIQLMNEQGLDDAVQNIMEGKDKAGSLTKAFDSFLKANPDINKEDKRLLTDYITLLGL